MYIMDGKAVSKIVKEEVKKVEESLGDSKKNMKEMRI